MKLCFLVLALTVMICTLQGRHSGKHIFKDHHLCSQPFRTRGPRQPRASETLPVLPPCCYANDLNQKYPSVHKNSTKNVSNYSNVTEISSTTIICTNHERPLEEDFFTTTDLNNSKTKRSNLPQCIPQRLGPIRTSKNLGHGLLVFKNKYPQVHNGGQYSPTNCSPVWRVAIIVPYRNRREHLQLFLDHMHPFLMRQELEYGMYIIEQAGNYDFNRAKLLNVGSVISQNLTNGKYQCFIFHDVDLLPLDTRNMYSCPQQPRNHAFVINRNIRWPLSKNHFGGVSAITEEQFKKVNGFSNNYWGWGAEDDDMVIRLKKFNYTITLYNKTISRYIMLKHKKARPNPERFSLLKKTRNINNIKLDGLSNLSFKLVKITLRDLFTHVLADIEVDKDVTLPTQQSLTTYPGSKGKRQRTKMTRKHKLA